MHADCVPHQVSEEDDLFDAGLSSISAARLREALDACTSLTLPLNLIYEHTTVPALAAALLLLLKRAASGAGAAAGAGAEARAPSRADDEPPRTDDDAGHVTSGGAGAVNAGACDGAVEEEEPSLLLPRATEAFRQGALSRAEALCLRAAARLGITPLLIRQSACFAMTPGAPPPPASSAMGAVPGASLGAVPGASFTQLPTAAATAPVLVLLIGVWSLQERWAEAAEACDWLLTLRAVDCLIRSSGAVPQGLPNRHALREAALSTMSTRELLDTALVTMQMARFAAAAGDASAATTALACADAALTGYQAALGTALRSPHGLTESAVSSATQRAAETDEIDETAFEDADGHVPEAPTTAGTPHTGVEPLARAQLPTTALPSPLPTERGWWSMHSATLTTLSVRRRALVELPEALGGLRALRVLDASENQLRALPDDLSHLIELGELLLSSNDFSQLPCWLADLPQLHVLSLQDNAFASLPPVVLRCAKLKHLRWGLQRRTRAADETDETDEIDETDETDEQRRTRAAEGGDEGELPSDGAVSSSTRRVELDTTGAFASPHLAVLELEGNDQTSLPLLPMHASALTALLASFNRLHDPPSPLTQTPPQAPTLTPTPPLTRPPTQLLEQLTTTHLGRHLKRLQLGSNGIVSVAELLPALPNVSTLCLEANRLTELPRSIGQLRQLRELWLFGNQLRQLPEELGECAQLTKLEAHHNRLLDLPTSLRKLTKLKSLYVQANELTNLAELRERVLRHLPLLNLGLGANQFDLKEAFEWPGTRVGLGWNRGTPPSQLAGTLNDRLALVDHHFEPACVGHRAPVLLVAFAAQGPGMQQWQVPCAAARAAGGPLDVLYLADPSNSYYLQDPRGGWEGLAHYGALIDAHAAPYESVLMLGSSMGATAALQHAHRAARVLAFGPRVDLRRSHGSFVPDAAKNACAQAIDRALEQHAREHASGGGTANGGTGTSGNDGTGVGRVAVHVGSGNLEDMTQAARVRGRRAVVVVEHDTFHHNVPMHLEREGLLVPLLKRELVELVRELVRVPAALPAS